MELALGRAAAGLAEGSATVLGAKVDPTLETAKALISIPHTELETQRKKKQKLVVPTVLNLLSAVPVRRLESVTPYCLSVVYALNPESPGYLVQDAPEE